MSQFKGITSTLEANERDIKGIMINIATILPIFIQLVNHIRILVEQNPDQFSDRTLEELKDVTDKLKNLPELV